MAEVGHSEAEIINTTISDSASSENTAEKDLKANCVKIKTTATDSA